MIHMSISLDSISSLVNNTTTSAANTTASSLEDTLNSNSLSSASDDELMDVCKEFESYFIEQVYKEMQKTVPEDEDGDASMSQLTDYFKDNMIQELASQTTEQSGGSLAKQLYDQMKRNYNLD